MMVFFMFVRFTVILSLLPSLESSFWSKKKQNAQTNPVNDIVPDIMVQVFENGDWTNGHSLTIARDVCEGTADLGEVICTRVGFNPNCALFSAWGTRVTSCADLKTDDNVFMVPHGRLFMLPTRGIGYRTEIAHIQLPTGNPIILETISVNPRIFKILNFFTEEEADSLIENALSIEDDAHKLKRSSTGTKGYSIDPKRTSENAFDQKSETAMAIKRRSFDLLGLFPYEESLADGIQVLRYNTTTGYATHMDWIAPPPPHQLHEQEHQHNYDSAEDGTNRFATILLYLSDVEEGGETVFPYVDRVAPSDSTSRDFDAEQPVSSHPMSKTQNTVEELNRLVDIHTVGEDTLEYLAEKNLTETFRPGGWQRETVHNCRTRLAVKPRKAEAVLFYSTFPNGKPNYLSTHGACPVITGEKWAANLWVWNGPRTGYWKKNSVTGKYEKPSVQAVSASFESSDVIGARLFWEDQLWEELTPGRPIKVNTYGGHKWQVKLDGELLAVWVIDGHKANQRFVLSSQDLPSYGHM